LSAENFKTNGFSATNSKSLNFDPDKDGFHYTTSMLSFGYYPSESVKLYGDLLLKGGYSDYDRGWVDYDRFFGDLRAQVISSENLLWDVKLSNNEERRNEHPYGEYRGITRFFEVQPTYFLNEMFFLSGGVSFKQELARIPSKHSADTKSVFGEIHTDYFGIHTTLSVRRDFHNRFGNKTTYKVSSSYSFRDLGTTLKGQYGTGFKAPTLPQIYSGWYGNLNLLPQESEGWTIGLRQDLREFGDIEVNYFKNNIFNAIDWDYSNWKYINSRGKTEGVEVKFRINLTSNLGLFGNYSHLHVEGDKQFTLRKPEISYTVGLRVMPIQSLKISLWTTHYSSRKDVYYTSTFVPKFTKLPSFNTYNCYVSYRLNEKVELYAKGVNLTDKDYELAYGYNTMGRALFVGTNFTIK